MSYKCLITESFHPLLQENLQRAGIICDVQEDIQTQGVEDIIHQYDVLVVNSKILVSEKMLEKAGRLKAIGRVGSGMEIIDLVACSKRGIKVFSAPEGNAPAVGEHTLGLLLDAMRNISKANHEMSNGQWIREGNRGESLFNKVVAIIGYGHAGSAFANVLSGFKVHVIANDIQAKHIGLSYVKQTDMEEIYQRADVVSLHLPLSESTNHYANQTFFNQFKKNIYFLNTSRGMVCKTADLLEAIQKGKVIGAGLDVFENEKPNSFDERELKEWNQLKQLTNVVTTPHIAGWTVQSKQMLAEIMANKIIKSLKA